MEAEAELERFREQWRAEVARNKQQETSSNDAARSQRPSRRKEQSSSLPLGGPSSGRRKDLADFSEEIEPRAYHDLPDKEQGLKLGTEDQKRVKDLYQEPSSALEHYERAVEKETQGQLGDSMRHYRTAFKVSSPP